MASVALLRGETRQVVFALVLFVLVLNAATDTLRLEYAWPLIFVAIAVGAFAITAAGLELAGHPSHRMGTISAILGLILAFWLTITAESVDHAPATSWIPVLVLWLVLMSSRAPATVAVARTHV